MPKFSRSLGLKHISVFERIRNMFQRLLVRPGVVHETRAMKREAKKVKYRDRKKSGKDKAAEVRRNWKRS